MGDLCEIRPVSLAELRSDNKGVLISHGNPAVFVQRPISLTFLIMTVALIVVLVAPMVRSTRERAFQEEG